MGKILLLFSSSQIGGAERSLTRMVLASTNKGVSYQLATLGGRGPWCDWVNSKGHEPKIYSWKLFGSNSLWKLLLDISSKEYKCVYVCGLKASIFVRLFVFFFPDIRVIHGVRWNPDTNNVLDRIFRFVETWLHPMVDHWIVNSQKTKNTLKNRCGIASDKITLIYNGVEHFSSAKSLLIERPMEILTVANFSPRKGHLEYLKVIQNLIKKIPNVHFTFVGLDNSNGSIQRELHLHQLNLFVSCPGFANDVSYYYERARLVVLPSLWGEGCPTSILEAFAHKIPVVAYEIDGIPELVTHGKNGFLAPPHDTDALEDYILRLLNSPELLEKMGYFGYSMIREQFTLKNCASLHDQILGGY